MHLLRDYIYMLCLGQVIGDVKAHKVEAANSLHCRPITENWKVVSRLALSEVNDNFFNFADTKRHHSTRCCLSLPYVDSSSPMIRLTVVLYQICGQNRRCAEHYSPECEESKAVEVKHMY